MSSLRNPVGPQPASVYWRRRIVALVGLIAVITCIVLIVSSLVNGGPATPTPTPTTAETPGGTTGGGTAEAKDCNPAVIRLVPVTDSNSYPRDQQPMISMTITNTGSVPCTLDVGTGQQLYSIVSGSDPIWNSADCQTDPQPFEQVLAPNETLTTTPFAWDRTRSSTSTCDQDRPAVVAGGATYRLSVSLGDIESASDTPFILQ